MRIVLAANHDKVSKVGALVPAPACELYLAFTSIGPAYTVRWLWPHNNRSSGAIWRHQYCIL